jgi:hypothetical protein
MAREETRLRIGRSRYFGIEEQGLCALLLVIVVIQVACAIGTLSDGSAGDSPQVAMTQPHDETMLAKR